VHAIAFTPLLEMDTDCHTTKSAGEGRPVAAVHAFVGSRFVGSRFVGFPLVIDG
jgi:hypothetical protein